MKPLFVLPPDRRFGELCHALDSLGWRAVTASSRPLLPGEPEHATFENSSGGRLQYTFNPACGLRVIELSGSVESALRVALAPVDAAQVAAWLGARNETSVLRGVMAAGLLRDETLRSRLEALRQHASSLVARAAERTLEQHFAATSRPKTEVAPAPSEVLRLIEFLRVQVSPLLWSLARDRSGETLRQVRPRSADYALAFAPAAVESARAGYDSLWGGAAEGKLGQLYPEAGQTVLIFHLAPAGMLREENELSRHFPGGYRQIVQWLVPQRVWVRWKFTRPGETAGLAFDGLVWLEDRWVWFPKPYRVLGSLLGVAEARGPEAT